MGEIRYGPGGLPEAPTFEGAFAALAAEDYRACEIGFVSGFWLDYETAIAELPAGAWTAKKLRTSARMRRKSRVL